jgi:uncharacterized cupin superfamily protein
MVNENPVSAPQPGGMGGVQAERFHEVGYGGPIRILTPQERRRFLDTAVVGQPPPPLDWPKGHAASSRAYCEISSHPAIMEVVTELIGDNIMLWGASVQTRNPGVVHPWHCDIESSDPSSRTVAVWIGLEGTNRDSSLRIVPYSHLFGETIQEARFRRRIARNEVSNDAILTWARERDARAEVVSLEMTDGDALFFDGKLWHGSDNVSGGIRHALLLQFAPPDDPIRIPDLRSLDWPFKVLQEPKPPCLLLRGRDTAHVNRFVPAPTALGGHPEAPLRSGVHPLEFPLAPPDEDGWKVHSLFRGPTADVGNLSCHASALTHERSPHPPHAHDEEELLILLCGEVELTLPDRPDFTNQDAPRLTPGGLVYYPAGFAHSLKTTSPEPANYLMFKWLGDPSRIESPLPFGRFDAFGETTASVEQPGFQTRLVFEGATGSLRKLHCHASTLTPGEGYEPHVDAYDVAVVVFEGELETLGERARPHDVIFYRGGEAHGMRNRGDVTARYLVFEFHGSRSLSGAAGTSHPALEWKRRLKGILPPKMRHQLRRIKERVSRHPGGSVV